jgi:hypothetical protein
MTTQQRKRARRKVPPVVRHFVEFNVNDHVQVKLTDEGRGVLRGARWPFTEDADGWARFQMWELMQLLGPHIYMGFSLLFETTVRIETPNAEALPRREAT